LAARGETAILIGFSTITTGARFGLLAGFASVARTLAFATGFFLAGVFVAMTGPIPLVNVELPEKSGIHSMLP
jgi:hypothetical protein